MLFLINQICSELSHSPLHIHPHSCIIIDSQGLDSQGHNDDDVDEDNNDDATSCPPPPTLHNEERKPGKKKEHFLKA